MTTKRLPRKVRKLILNRASWFRVDAGPPGHPTQAPLAYQPLPDPMVADRCGPRRRAPISPTS